MEQTESRVSRRSLLKRAGVGAALVGGGALVTSPIASAQPTLAGLCAELSAGNDGPACGPCDYQVNCGDGCGCVVGTDGCCFCHQGQSCTGAKACKHNSDCPPGWKCAFTCCPQGPICVQGCWHPGVQPNGVAAKLQPGNSSTRVGR